MEKTYDKRTYARSHLLGRGVENGDELNILTKDELNKKLYDYYVEHYGEKDTDEGVDPPAVNVWIFKRDNKNISLKALILSGNVEAFVES